MIDILFALKSIFHIFQVSIMAAYQCMVHVSHMVVVKVTALIVQIELTCNSQLA